MRSPPSRALGPWLPSLMAAAGLACGAGPGAAQRTPVSPPAGGSPIATFADSFVHVTRRSERAVSGWVSVHFDAATNGYRLTEVVGVAAFTYHTAEVFFGPDLTIDSARAMTRTGARFLDYAVSYTGRHATGWYTTSPADSAPRIMVDAVLPESAFDASAVMALLPTLPWAVGMKRTLFEFDPISGMTQTQLLSVVDTEQVTVPAGTFDTFRAELTEPYFLEEQWYTRSLPHRCVKRVGVTDDWSAELVH